jgi:hypothetical protein
MLFTNEFCETVRLCKGKVPFTTKWMKLEHQLMYTVTSSAYIEVVKQTLTVAV